VKKFPTLNGTRKLPCSQGPPPIRIPSKISTFHALRTDFFKMRLLQGESEAL